MAEVTHYMLELRGWGGGIPLLIYLTFLSGNLLTALLSSCFTTENRLGFFVSGWRGLLLNEEVRAVGFCVCEVVFLHTECCTIHRMLRWVI